MKDLPVGWTYEALSDVCEVVQGQSPPGSTYNFTGEGLPFFQGKAEFGDIVPTPRKWCTRPRKVAEPGDVLISVRAPVGPTNVCMQTSAIGRGLAALRPPPDMPTKYLLYALRSSVTELTRQSTGTTFDAISGKTLREHLVPIAPSRQQKAIVDEIEKQFARLEAAVGALHRARTNLTRYRAAVLQAAVSGQLIRRSTWENVKLGDVTEIRAGIQKQPKRKPVKNHFPFLRVANVLSGYLDLSEIHRAELFEGELERWRLDPGDLLIVEGNGSPSQIGRMAVWNGEIQDAVHQNHLIRARPVGVDPRWAEICWNSPQGRRQLLGVASSTSGLYTLSTGKVSKITLPLPTEHEQADIAEEVERLLSFASHYVRNVAAVLNETDRLRRSILADAFSGRFVTGIEA